ncbi:YajQ family cyclic di-GMP-binding protein [Larkinella terrae]|uniref:Nucleotide-binding protein GJJ30_15345 n=1 Tax=Larkinella terrae TaxID=2025311 RepID=A0A7K0ELK9_9BACT|nr:YajQ family cyclic di-GMP-binding protein [Larkinella terrae]MRS62675.1 YajQ family cyclic di-GMP-binding protein [Larkinella terrae]
MASFDIVSKVDLQTLDNAINVAIKEIANRYDLRNSKTSVDLNKKDLNVKIDTDNDMSLKSVEDILLARMVKQGVDGRSLDFTAEPQQSGNRLRRELKIRQGLDKDQQRKILKLIKDQFPKITAQAMDDQVRVTSKKIDDLQAVIGMLRRAELDVSLQFVNMKS